MKYYKYYSCGSNTQEDGQKVRLFRFKNEYNDHTMVEIFHYDYNVYAFKFFLKKHRDSDHRYSLSYPQRFLNRKKTITGAKNFFLTMNTIIKIALNEILENDKYASFGFLGAPKQFIEDKRINDLEKNKDGTVANTTRYRIYSIYARRIFSPTSFEYIDSKSSSIMLLRNNKNKENLTIKNAEQFIKEKIIPNL